MSDSANHYEKRPPPVALEPPFVLDDAADEFTLWSGQAKLVKGTASRSGTVHVDFRLNPRPAVRFEFGTGHRDLSVLKEAFFGIQGDAALVTDDLLGEVSLSAQNGPG